MSKKSKLLPLNRRTMLAGGLIAGAAALGASRAVAAPRPRSGYAPSDGLRVYYEDHGRADDPVPVVLLHGGVLAIETAFSQDLLPRLARTRRVIAIEQQGHGHTADRPGPLTIDRFVADTVAVLRHLRIGRADLFGHSLGGMIAVGTAIKHPGTVRSLTALSSGYSEEGNLPELREMQRNPRHVPSPELQPLLPSQADFAAWQAHYRRYAPRPEAMPEVMAKLQAMIVAWRGWSAAELGAIRSPALLVIGDQDFVSPAHAAEMARMMPDAQFAVLPGTTHMSILQRGAWIEPMFAARLGTLPAKDSTHERSFDRPGGEDRGD